MRAVVISIVLSLTAIGARADTALIVMNSRYDSAQEFEALEPRLTSMGFDVITITDGTTADMRTGVETLLEANETDRVLIAVAGHVAHAGGRSWILGGEADTPNLATVDAQGIAVDVLMMLAGRAPGRAVVLLGTEQRRIALGDGLSGGLGRFEAPQGVTVLSGAPDDLMDMAADTILRPGANLAEAVARTPAIEARGFLSPTIAFIDPSANDTEQNAEEIALWAAAQDVNTEAAYRAYLRDYPNGTFAAEAQSRLDALNNNPEARAAAAEDALSLTRAERQQIQRELSLLGHDTRGIDGIFGPGTRGAIRAWQTANGYAPTGYISAEHLPPLEDEAARRAAELEEQARLRQEEINRSDRAYWQALGQGQSEDALRNYLGRYPNGLYAEIATERLGVIESERRAQAEAQERVDWDAAEANDTIDSYETYLGLYPDGLFRDTAQNRIAALQAPQQPSIDPEARAQAEAQEASLNLQPVMRIMVERRLAGLGLEPGAPDGQFDDQTRLAIGQYQTARGIPPTGYLDQTTATLLLAEAIGGTILQ